MNTSVVPSRPPFPDQSIRVMSLDKVKAVQKLTATVNYELDISSGALVVVVLVSAIGLRHRVLCLRPCNPFLIR